MEKENVYFSSHNPTIKGPNIYIDPREMDGVP